MAILLVLPGRDAKQIASLIQAAAPEADILTAPYTGPASEVDFIVAWNHTAGELSRYSRAKGIMSFGAGADHILRDPYLPAGVPAARVVDPQLAADLSEYLLAVVLGRKRMLDGYRDDQLHKRWRPRPYPARSHVGILGLGSIGMTAAVHFAALGFQVTGWSRTPKTAAGITCLTGPDVPEELLALSDYLICLLPLTPRTAQILNYGLFSRMKPGAYLVNAGRGGHLAEQDLLRALDDGLLAGACLDVFGTEPLSTDHPFWERPEIRVTPHISALTGPQTAVEQIVANYRRVRSGQPMCHLIDTERGY